MARMKISSTTPETAALAEIGERVRNHRVSMNATQVELARSAGVSARTVERLETGHSVQLDNLLRILRALKLSDNLDQLVPEAAVRPIQLAGSGPEVRRRSYKRRSTQSHEQGWTWGDKR